MVDKVTKSWSSKSKATKAKILKGGELINERNADDDVDEVKSRKFAETLRFETLGSDPHKDTSLGMSWV